MDPKVSEAFGRNLRLNRKAKGFSQEQLAHESGIDRSYIGKMERGLVNVTIEKIYVLARCLGCSPKELVPDL